jgi:transcriptional regulator with XRE-family HTH domain
VSSLGQRVRQHRKAAGLSIRQLAEAVGAAHSSLSRLERGDLKEVRSSTLIALADCLGVSLDDLVHGEAEPTPLTQLEDPEVLVKSYPFPAYVTQDDLIVAVNRPLLELTGYSREELLGSQARYARFLYPDARFEAGRYLGITRDGGVFSHSIISAPMRGEMVLHVVHPCTEEAMEKAITPLYTSKPASLEEVFARIQGALRYLGVRGVVLSVTRIPGWETHLYSRSVYFHLTPEEVLAREPRESWRAARSELERCHRLGIAYDRYLDHLTAHPPLSEVCTPRRMIDVPILGGTFGVGWAGDLTPIGFLPFLQRLAGYFDHYPAI